MNSDSVMFDGIPFKLQFRSLSEELSAEPDLQALNKQARELGWRNALRKHGSHRYVTDPGRARFIELFDLSGKHVLEIGCSLGQHTVEIAKRAAHVDALDTSLHQILFTRQRCIEEGARNVTLICGGDDCRLPYADGQFDIVFMNLVLEWCAGRLPNETHELGQRRMLGEIARVMKPAGVFQIATKNRFSIHYMIGRPDEHAYNLPFGHALPRPLMNAMLRIAGHRRANGSIYSHNELRRMLCEAGLSVTKAYWSAPEVRYPTRFVELEIDAIRRARSDTSFCQGAHRSQRFFLPVLPARLVKYFIPGHFFVGTK